MVAGLEIGLEIPRQRREVEVMTMRLENPARLLGKLPPLLLLLALAGVAQAQFAYTTNDGTITLTKYTGAGGLVNIPDTITGLPVTGIGDGASITAGI